MEVGDRGHRIGKREGGGDLVNGVRLARARTDGRSAVERKPVELRLSPTNESEE